MILLRLSLFDSRWYNLLPRFWLRSICLHLRQLLNQFTPILAVILQSLILFALTPLVNNRAILIYIFLILCSFELAQKTAIMHIPLVFHVGSLAELLDPVLHGFNFLSKTFTDGKVLGV